LVGGLLLAAGLIIIAHHQQWSSVAAVLISLFGWYLALRAVVLLAAPEPLTSSDRRCRLCRRGTGWVQCLGSRRSVADVGRMVYAAGTHLDGRMILLAAGVIAGALNAIAGGGTFVTLPALTLAGLPTTTANASSAVALLPGTLASWWALRCDVRPLPGISVGTLLAVNFVGGLIGAILLLSTSDGAFDKIVPWLLLGATLALISGTRLVERLRALGFRVGVRKLLMAQFALGVYGGYFGGAVGLMMLAVWSLFIRIDLRTVTPLRVLMVAAANGVAVVCFASSGVVRWRETLLVMAGAVLGGYSGAYIAKALPERIVRTIVVMITAATTAAFFLRASQ
jgi:uncharacterized membrane protein YfcA